MLCPHCLRILRVHESTAALGLVMRVRSCHQCRRSYRTEERCVEEVELRTRLVITKEQRRAERERWHREHSKPPI